MRAGLLTELIEIQSPEITKSDFGDTSVEWSVFASNVRADAYSRQGNRTLENGEIIWAYTTSFRIRTIGGLKHDMVVIWNDEKYRILSLQYSRDRREVVINTELINE